MKILKFILDVLVGLIIPVLILTNLSGVLGNVTAYTLSALIPAVYVLVDTYWSRRFNAITTFIAIGALIRSGFTFWYVDGWLFAFKDSAPYLFPVFLFGGTFFLNKPVFAAFMRQLLNPETERQRIQAERLLAQPRSKRGIQIASLVIALQSLIVFIINFIVNLIIVVAPFATAEFNRQVALANVLIGPLGSASTLAAFLLAFYIAYRYMYSALQQRPILDFTLSKPVQFLQTVKETMNPSNLFKLMDDHEARAA